MIRARLLTAAALLLAPCLMVGCDDAESEPSVGGVPPANPVPADGADMESGSEMDAMNAEDDPGVERPSEGLEEEDGGV